MWCWASSVEMVLSYQGVSIPQGVIVAELSGFFGPIDRPGDPVDMIAATNRCIPLGESQKLASISGQFVQGPPHPNVLFNHLVRRKPLILAYQSGPWMGHAVVVHGMDYRVESGPLGTAIVPVRFHVADPFCYTQTRDFFGTIQVVENRGLRSRIYDFEMPPGATPFPGRITGAILVDCSTL